MFLGEVGEVGSQAKRRTVADSGRTNKKPPGLPEVERVQRETKAVRSVTYYENEGGRTHERKYARWIAKMQLTFAHVPRTLEAT